MDKKLEELLKNGLNDFDHTRDFLKIFLEGVLKPISIEKYNEFFSKDIDELIISLDNDGKKFIGGYFSYVVADDKHFMVRYEIYTQSQEKKYYKNKGEAGPFLMSLFDEKSVSEIRVAHELKFEIFSPLEK